MTAILAYKFLRPGARGPFSGFEWPVPSGGDPGPWVEAAQWRETCRGGIHACRLRHLPLWIWEELWEVELAGDVEDHAQKLRARRGRVLRRIQAWNAPTAKAFAADCARQAAAWAGRALVEAGLEREATPFAEPRDLDAVRAATTDLWERLPEPARIPAGMASDGAARALVAEASDDPYVAAHGGAVSAYIAAMTALRVSGREAFGAERARQADWLATELGL